MNHGYPDNTVYVLLESNAGTVESVFWSREKAVRWAKKVCALCYSADPEDWGFYFTIIESDIE